MDHRPRTQNAPKEKATAGTGVSEIFLPRSTLAGLLRNNRQDQRLKNSPLIPLAPFLGRSSPWPEQRPTSVLLMMRPNLSDMCTLPRSSHEFRHGAILPEETLRPMMTTRPTRILKVSRSPRGSGGFVEATTAAEVTLD